MTIASEPNISTKVESVNLLSTFSQKKRDLGLPTLFLANYVKLRLLMTQEQRLRVATCLRKRPFFKLVTTAMARTSKT